MTVPCHDSQNASDGTMHSPQCLRPLRKFRLCTPKTKLAVVKVAMKHHLSHFQHINIAY